MHTPESKFKFDLGVVLPRVEAALEKKLPESAWLRVECPPPLRLHVRAAVPGPQRLEALLPALGAQGELESPEKVPENLALHRWLAPLLDHTLLRSDADLEDFTEHCSEARELGTGAVCLPSAWVAFGKERLAGSKIGVVATIAFPAGTNSTPEKLAELKRVLDAGAQEVDVVANLEHLKNENWSAYWQDIFSVCQAADPKPVKAILEMSALNDFEKVAACLLARAAGAHFVKTSTGAHPSGGATARDVAMMRAVVGGAVGVKASGGIRNLGDALAMLTAGADRIGTSNSRQILKGAQK